MLRLDDLLTVQALPSFNGRRFGEFAEYEVVRDLPDPTFRSGISMLRPVKLATGRSASRRRLLRRGFDVVHIEMLTYQTDWLDLATLRARPPLVSIVHDVRPHEHSMPRKIEDFLLRRTYQSAGDLIVYGEQLRDELIRDFNVDRSRTHVLPIPLDSEDRRDTQVNQPDRPLFLFFGALRANKGINILFEALKVLSPEFDADIHIAGRGDPKTESMIEATATRFGNVTLELGRVSDQRKRELFSMASWVILPYTVFHSQSGVLADAYSFRVPVIATDVGVLGPTVRADGTGLVVEPSSIESLAAAMHEAALMDTTRIKAQISEAAMKHDYSVVGPRLREIYELAVERQSP